MQISLGNLSVSAVVYNDTMIPKTKKYKSEALLDFCKKSKDSYLPILMQIIQLQMYFDPIVCI